MVQLLLLLCCCDDAVLRWPRGGGGGGGGGGSVRAAATVPRWQPLAAQLLVLTPYFFGGVAKLNPDWLLRHEPVRSWNARHVQLQPPIPCGHSLRCMRLQVRTWAPDMLEKLDAALGGWLDRTLPAVDVVPPFAAAICWSPAGLNEGRSP